mmetsp:Transcript_76359/g.149808  ORF Transcript_76359/g.149808 Transcript_76359/m.149808 type:complete len:222 (+) Transcript_76359:491-1156(+)
MKTSDKCSGKLPYPSSWIFCNFSPSLSKSVHVTNFSRVISHTETWSPTEFEPTETPFLAAHRRGESVNFATSPTVIDRTDTSMPSCTPESPRMNDVFAGASVHFSAVPSGPPEESIANRTCATHFTGESARNQSSFNHKPPSPAETRSLRTEPSPKRSFSLAPSAESVLPKAKLRFSPASSSFLSCFKRSWTVCSCLRASLFCASSWMIAMRSALASVRNC